MQRILTEKEQKCFEEFKAHNEREPYALPGYVKTLIGIIDRLLPEFSELKRENERLNLKEFNWDAYEQVITTLQIKNDKLQASLTNILESSPDDIRTKGWVVAVHNDYMFDGEPHTFWLFTKEGRAVKGEGRSDSEALNQIRQALAELTEKASEK